MVVLIYEEWKQLGDEDESLQICCCLIKGGMLYVAQNVPARMSD